MLTDKCGQNSSALLYFLKCCLVLEMIRGEARRPVWKAGRTTSGDRAVSCPFPLGNIHQRGINVNPAAYGSQSINVRSCLVLNS